MKIFDVTVITPIVREINCQATEIVIHKCNYVLYCFLEVKIIIYETVSIMRSSLQSLIRVEVWRLADGNVERTTCHQRCSTGKRSFLNQRPWKLSSVTLSFYRRTRDPGTIYLVKKWCLCNPRTVLLITTI